MLSHNFKNPLHHERAFPAHINGDHDHVSLYKSSDEKDNLA